MDGATTTSVETTTAPMASATMRRTADTTIGTQAAAEQAPAMYTGPQKLSGKYRHVAAVHSATRPSTLSHDSKAAPSFLGFRNLMVIVLVVGNLRLMIENMQKYGNLICLTCHDFRRQDLVLGALLYVLIPCFLFIAYSLELIASSSAQASKSQKSVKDRTSGPTEEQRIKFQTTWRTIRALHTVNATIALAITSWVVYNFIHHPLIGTATELHIIIVYLKMASYALTNRDLRHAYLHPVKGELAALPSLYEACPYPNNITLSNLVYFWWAPTLVYQPVYPRSDKIRWSFVAKRLGEVACLTVFIWFISEQYAAPVLWNSLEKVHTLNWVGMTERLFKLSTISLVVWLAGFFAIFQSTLNALAEVMRFGDRNFYDDWWNSASLGEYWRLWNKPVYQFMKRHVYIPMVGRGYKGGHASIAVFVVSGILHELAVGVPTHNIIGVAFLGMMIQLPLIALTLPLSKMGGSNGKLVGNIVFWVSFTIFGQPFAALLYFYAWQAKYGSVSRSMPRMGQGVGH
ncbi:putative diacylglycerol O-acyltransferase [Microdochium bolleyi]|uniref:O-acyltransferase n=1 Tax=Microdochium bolleyi TaxID=196109 RepID=A0A136JC73_9PEZI|nr:putative diacylglycerol O-acyltransferase [Microdochium bolleyi]